MAYNLKIVIVVALSVCIACNVYALSMAGHSMIFCPNKSTVNEQKDDILKRFVKFFVVQ